MKEIKKKVSIQNYSIVFLVLFAVMIWSFPAFAAVDELAANRDKFSNYEEIRDIVNSSGKVRIIVNLEVPGIDELTAESRRYRITKSRQDYSAKRIDADIALKEGISAIANAALNRLNGTQYRLNRIYSNFPYMALEVSGDALAILASLPEVGYIQKDRLFRLVEPEKEDPKVKKVTTASPDLSRPMLDGSVDIIGARNAWDMGYTGEGWYVAVLDTGIRSTHEFFNGKEIVEACFASGESSLGDIYDGDCPNGEVSMTGPGSAVHYPDNRPQYDHGTHVTGIAVGNNGNLYGVARDANIIAIQVFSDIADCYPNTPGAQPCVGNWESDTLAGLDYVLQISGSYNIASVNISIQDEVEYGSPCDGEDRVRRALSNAIDALWDVNIPTVICTGNSRYCDGVSSPACISKSVAVGASNNDDNKYSTSNWHETMQSLFAPGHLIYSATGDSDNSYGNKTGTSMAAPHVAGAWALMKQVMPLGTVPDLLSALRDTGVGITAVCDGHTNAIPRIQVDAAILSLIGTGAITVTAPNGGEGWKLGSTKTITWDAEGISNDLKIVLLDNNINVGPIVKFLDPGLGSYTWEVGRHNNGTFFPPGTNYKIRIQEMEGAMVYDDSDASFSIGDINITSPGGGEEWTIGSTENITWIAEGLTKKVKIVLFQNGVSLGRVKINLNPDLGTYSWEVGKLEDGTIVAPGIGYTIRIREQAGSLVYEDSNVFSLAAPPIEQNAYPNGVPWPVPGAIEAENYDIGGEGIAYHDTTPGNICNPPRYRFEDVDIQLCYDTGGGYNVGWIEAGEWLEYTIDVTQSGYYDFDVRAAAPGGGQFRLEYFTPSSQDPMLLTTREFLPTGGAQEWKTVTIPRLYLSQGEMVLRFYAETGSFNLNYFLIRVSDQSAYLGTPWTIPGRIEAEDYDIGGEGISYHDTTPGNRCYYQAYRFDDVDVENSPLSGSTINVGYIDVDEWLEYTVDIAQGGYYTISARVASPTGGGAKIEIDGIDIIQMGFRVTNMGPQDYSTVTSIPVYLPQGKLVLRVKMLESLWNFDYLEFVSQ